MLNSSIKTIKYVFAAIFIMLLLLLKPCFSQQKDSIINDSLEQLISDAVDDSVKASLTLQLASKLRKKDPEKMLSLALELINLAKQSGNELHLGNAYHLLAQYNLDINDYIQVIKNDKKALSIALKYDDKKLIVGCENEITIAYRTLGQYENAIKYAHECLLSATKWKDTLGSVSAYNNIAIVYFFQKDFKQALEYFTKALYLAKQLGEQPLIAKQLNNLGIVYKNSGDIERALEYYLLELNTWNKLNDLYGQAVTFLNIGSLYSQKEEYDKALEYMEKSLVLRRKLKDKRGLCETYSGIANLELNLHHYSKVLSLADSALITAREIGYKQLIKEALGVMSQAYEETGQPGKALYALRESYAIKDSLDNLSNKEALARMESSFKAEMKDNKIKLLEEHQKLQEEKIKHSTTQRNMLILGVIMLLSVGLLLFRSFRLKHKANIILKQQNLEIEEKNKRITDSIVYASRIQNATLPSISLMEEYLGDGFVLFLPKDIVSGDFYWFAQDVETEKNKEIPERIFAVADCTGHGVPGAMMSVIGSTGLNRCIREFGLKSPEQILNKLNTLVEESLAFSGQELQDGMDIALCRILSDSKNGNESTLEYAGANNPLWIINHNRDEWPSNGVLFNNGHGVEIKPDKQPIGHFINRKPFNNNKVSLQKGDNVYIFSDGFADQFGGQAGKKYKIAQFKELLLSVSDKPMKEHAEMIKDNFYQWKGDQDQVDDICIIGIRI